MFGNELDEKFWKFWQKLYMNGADLKKKKEQTNTNIVHIYTNYLLFRKHDGILGRREGSS